ncbi:MAG TPA: hypothetical protein VF163_20695 [Micromonosporaceae bacterium]
MSPRRDDAWHTGNDPAHRWRITLAAAGPVATTTERESMQPDAILVDIDGTVALRGNRSPYDESKVSGDRPNAPVIAAVRAMHAAGHLVVFCSGRTERCRDDTQKWLADHVAVPYEALLMRTVGDARKDAIVKRELFERHIRNHYRVVAVFDDRNQVVAMWRRLGLVVFQVADGDF